MNEEQESQLVDTLAEAVFVACQQAQKDINPDIDPEILAGRVAAVILLSLATSKDHDNALITVKKVGKEEGWETHIHLDYLSASEEHLKNDFSWGVPESDEDHKEY